MVKEAHEHAPAWVIANEKPLVLEYRCVECGHLFEELSTSTYPNEQGQELVPVKQAEGLLACDCTVFEVALIALGDAYDVRSWLELDDELARYNEKISRLEAGILRRANIVRS